MPREMAPEVRDFLAVERALSPLSAEQKSRVMRAFSLLMTTPQREEDEAAE